MSLGVVVLAAACGDLKTAEPTNADGGAGAGAGAASSSGTTGGPGGSSGNGTTSSSSGTGSSSGNGGPAKGPGDYGALPFGYCCTADEECRDRHCAQVGSQKICLDVCRSPETCTGKGVPAGFTCDGSQSQEGFCQPPGGFTCLAADTFVLGTKTTGSCCSATGNGSNGLECLGGHCDWYKATSDPNYDPPFFCTNRCDAPADCGKGMKCFFEIGKCVPANEPFVCE